MFNVISRTKAMYLVMLTITATRMTYACDREKCYKAPSDTACTIEVELFDLTNEFRKKNGVPPLIWSKELGFAAREWADYQTALGSRSHRGFPYIRLKALKNEFPTANYNIKGENVAKIERCRRAKSQCIFESWKDDPGYTANLLNREYKHVGVGVADWGGLYSTQLFSY